jgi:2-dehydro-3-deoxygluconokinase
MSVACFGEPLVVFSTASALDGRTALVGEGGAEFNVAVHLARLGVDVRFVGAVGKDVLGRRLEARLCREGVDVSALHVEPGGHTGGYLKDRSAGDIVYLRADSAASRFVPPTDAFAGVRHVHLSGVTAALSDTCARTLGRLLARPRPFTVSFDVNHRTRLWSEAEAADPLALLANAADLVFVGRDEAARLWGTATADDVRHVLPDPPELVVKDEAREAIAWCGADRAALAPAPVDIIDPVGAGDAFAAGYLFARLAGRDLPAGLAAGHRLARAALRALDDLGDLGDPVPPAELTLLLTPAR